MANSQNPLVRIKTRSELVENIIKLSLGGNYTCYDKNVHIPLLVEIITASHPISTFCAQAHICRATFYNWLKTNPDFKYAYDLALPVGESNLLNLPLAKPEYPYAYWRLRMMNQYGYGKSSVPNLDHDSPVEKLNLLRTAVCQGEMTISEYVQLVGVVQAEQDLRNGYRSPEGSLFKHNKENLLAIINSD